MLRFYSPRINELLLDYHMARERIEDSLADFISELFRRFHAQRHSWELFISILAEIDCLLSLNTVSFSSRLSGTPSLTRPRFVLQDKPGRHSIIQLRGAIHPCVALAGVRVVPNDFCLSEQDTHTTSLVITGPNMV